MSQNDLNYYRKRAATKREAALASERADVAEVHLELARLYQALVDRADLRPRPKLRIVFPERLSA